MTRLSSNRNSPRSSAPRTRAAAEAIASRWRLTAWLASLGLGLAVAGAIGVVLVVVARGLGEAAWAIWAVAGLAVLAIVVSIARSLARPPQLESAAAAADEHAGSKDALVSALQLSDADGEDAGFAELAVSRAEQLAEKVSPREVAPVRLGRWWLAWPGFVAAACVAAVFLPPWAQSNDATQVSTTTTASSSGRPSASTRPARSSGACS
ncbi:MAG: hypothetical protein AAFV77_01800, partial [Planctomycetota bacterium]